MKGRQAMFGGVGLVLLGALAIWLVRDLSQGTLRSMGPAMLPRWLAVGVIACGISLLVAGFLRQDQGVEEGTFRGPLMVVIGILVFAVTIRGFDLGPASVPLLGMAVSGPLSIVVGGYATPEARLRELLILGFALTAACMILFGDLLNLPIPLYPQWFSDLYPSGFSNDARMRTTAAILVLLAVAVYYLMPAARHEPQDVVVDQHPGTLT